MAAIRDTIVDGKLHVAGDIVATGIVAYPDSDKKISYPKTTCKDSYVPLCGVDDYSSDSKLVTLGESVLYQTSGRQDGVTGTLSDEMGTAAGVTISDENNKLAVYKDTVSCMGNLKGPGTAASTISGALYTVTSSIYGFSYIKADNGNDFADFIYTKKPLSSSNAGLAVTRKGDNIVVADKRDFVLGIYSDTYGMSVGSNAYGTGNSVPVAVAGFALAYVDKEYKPGTPLAVKSRGQLTKAGLFRRIFNKKSIVGYFDRKETNDLYVSTHVNGRSWIKVI